MPNTNIDLLYTGTLTHPHVAAIRMDPTDSASAFDDRSEVRELGVDRRQPDHWTVYAACAGRAVRNLLENNW